MREPSKKELLAMTPKNAAQWVFSVCVDYYNPFEVGSDKFNHFANEYHKLTVERL